MCLIRKYLLNTKVLNTKVLNTKVLNTKVLVLCVKGFGGKQSTKFHPLIEDLLCTLYLTNLHNL